MTGPVRRDTARVILAGPDDQVLLFRVVHPAPWAREGWLTPGGGIKPGESPARTAVRELAEETGHRLTLAEVGHPVAVTSGQWQAKDILFDTVDRYFFARARTSAVDLSGQEDAERDELLGHRWWSVADLRATDDLVLPVGLADLAARLLAGDVPREPVRLPWR